MMKPFLAAMVLALSTSVAFAAEDSNLTTKAMKDLPGNNGAGTTADPTAKPNSGSLAEKQMQQQPGVNSDKTGKTATPNAKLRIVLSPEPRWNRTSAPTNDAGEFVGCVSSVG